MKNAFEELFVNLSPDDARAAEFLCSQEATDDIRGRIKSRDFWIMAFSPSSASLYSHLVKKYYSNKTMDDTSASIETCQSLRPYGICFLIAAFRKSAMPAPVFLAELKEATGAPYTEEELCRLNIIICVQPIMAQFAVHVCQHLINGDDEVTEEFPLKTNLLA
jgi:hypothetical protein